MRGIVSD